MSDSDNRPCTRCNGLGKIDDYHYRDGQWVITGQIECFNCKGSSEFPPLDVAFIRSEIFSSRKPYNLKTSVPSYKVAARSYYVWRLARFHGGIDLTMPMVAIALIAGDPFVKELDALADVVAKEVFGSNMRAAARWGKAMGYF